VYNGVFELIDYWTEKSGGRRVFKFKLRLANDEDNQRPALTEFTLDEDRLIPRWVKLEVWKRDNGRCCKCGKASDLHFDHVIPYSKGGSSKDPANIQILCGQHNLAKRDKIE
jgi:5-methylcytosine-specific restriction endonuclease McrA